jgi:hypothetical protein
MRFAFAALLAFTLALPLPAACAAPGSAAEAGKLDIGWSIEADAGQRAKNQVQFALTRRTANSRWMHSTTRPLADLAGLTAVQLASGGGMPVGFRFRRDAGTILCEGVVRRWHGTGDCRFQADAGFAAALAGRGVDLVYLEGISGRCCRVGSLAALGDMRDHGVTPD